MRRAPVPSLGTSLACLALPLALAVLLLAALPAASASAAPSPWWQLLTGSRPTNLPIAPDQTEVQEVKTTEVGTVFAAKLEIGGTVVGCLGAGELFGIPASVFCEAETGFPAAEGAAELEQLLVGPYGAGEVEVTGGPVGVAPFHISTRWGVARLKLTPILFAGEVPLGSASVKVITEGSGRLVITATNLGDAPLDATSTSLTIADYLPAGVAAYGVKALAGTADKAGPVDCALPSPGLVTCSFEGKLPSYETIEIEIAVALGPRVGAEPGELTVSGANAPVASATQPLNVSEHAAPFGLEHFSMRAEEEGGALTEQAGSHPFQVTTAITLRQTADPMPVDLPKDIRIKLPPGLLASAGDLPQCAEEQLYAEACPLSSVIGVATLTVNEPATLGITTLTAPVFDLEPSPGEPARFGLLATSVPVLIDTSLSSADHYAATLSITNITETAGFLGATISLWGVPADPRHDATRGLGCLRQASGAEGVTCESLLDRHQLALLTLPTSCATAPQSSVEVASWPQPHDFVSLSSTLPALTGCNHLAFAPTLATEPTAHSASSPTGLDFRLQVDDEGLLNPGGLAQSPTSRLELTLPADMTVNPPLASGLAACAPADLARETLAPDPGVGCPDAAKIGSVEAQTPLFSEPLRGAVFLAQPDDPATPQPGAENPDDSLLAFYFLLENRNLGIIVRQSVRVEPDPSTGRLTVVLTGAPPLPLSRLALHLREGPRAPLTTPPNCATHTIHYALTPVSDPTASLLSQTTFTIEARCAEPRFEPALSAGTTNNHAGASAPFVLDLSAGEGQPSTSRLSLTLPPGLAADLATVPPCPEPLATTAACPPDSRLGYVRIALGAGPAPLWVPAGEQPESAVYLAGPYEGAPYSLLIVVPAQAGPYDLGTVVSRAAIRIDPETAQATVALDPLPQILAGVPLQYRTIRLVLDRPGFTRNPTSCEPMAVNAVATATTGALATLSDRFQAADCAALGLRPHLALRLSGSVGRNAHPSITVDLRPRAADANLRAASVTLPYGVFFDPVRLRESCTRQLFAAGNCPPSARLGLLEADSPILEQPQRGPLYLLESANRLPDLAATLGGRLDLTLRGHLDTPHGRIRASFDSLPDVPLSHLRLFLPGGRRGLLVNSRDLCRGRPRAAASFVGHNGRRRLLRPRATATCGRSATGQSQRGARR